LQRTGAELPGVERLGQVLSHVRIVLMTNGRQNWNLF
jgi:hypothetical protein